MFLFSSVTYVLTEVFVTTVIKELVLKIKTIETANIKTKSTVSYINNCSLKLFKFNKGIVNCKFASVLSVIENIIIIIVVDFYKIF